MTIEVIGVIKCFCCELVLRKIDINGIIQECSCGDPERKMFSE